MNNKINILIGLIFPIIVADVFAAQTEESMPEKLDEKTFSRQFPFSEGQLLDAVIRGRLDIIKYHYDHNDPTQTPIFGKYDKNGDDILRNAATYRQPEIIKFVISREPLLIRDAAAYLKDAVLLGNKPVIDSLLVPVVEMPDFINMTDLDCEMEAASMREDHARRLKLLEEPEIGNAIEKAHPRIKRYLKEKKGHLEKTLEDLNGAEEFFCRVKDVMQRAQKEARLDGETLRKDILFPADQLFDAAASGRLDVIRSAFERGIELEKYRDEHGRDIIYYAVHGRQPKIIKYLISRMPLFSCKKSFYCALRTKNIPIINSLVSPRVPSNDVMKQIEMTGKTPDDLKLVGLIYKNKVLLCSLSPSATGTYPAALQDPALKFYLKKKRETLRKAIESLDPECVYFRRENPGSDSDSDELVDSTDSSSSEVEI